VLSILRPPFLPKVGSNVDAATTDIMRSESTTIGLRLSVGIDASSGDVDLESLEDDRSEFGPRRHDRDDSVVSFIGSNDLLANKRAAGGS